MHDQCKQTIEMHERQCISAGLILDECRGHVSKTELPKRAVAEIMDKFQNINLNYENNFIPQELTEPKLQLINYLVQGANNPRGYKLEECIKCKSFTSYCWLHRLLECKKYTKQRKDIMESMSMDLEYYTRKCDLQVAQMTNTELLSKLNDIARQDM